MALSRSCSRVGSVMRLVRCYSKTDLANEIKIKKTVLISQSKDVYTNLALEDWLHKNFDFKNHHVLLLSQNEPAVVIGKNQNPWTDANFSELPSIVDNGVKLARRNTEGSALYHDLGTLNMTFFAPNEHSSQNNNLQVVSKALYREFGLKVDIQDNNLILRGNKHVSDTSISTGENNSCHQCSLLVSSNKVDVNLALQKHEVALSSNSKPTKRAEIMTLRDEAPKVTIPSAMSAIGWEFMRTKALTLKDGGLDLANQQKGFQMVNPTEYWFNGLNEIKDKYSSWNWCYGKTPKFHISRSFAVPNDLTNNQVAGISEELKVTMSVEDGKIADIMLYVPEGFSSFGFQGEAKVVSGLRGKKYSCEILNELEHSLGCLLDDKDRFVTECLKRVMRSA